MTGTPIFTNSAGDPPTAAELEDLARCVAGPMVAPPGWTDAYDLTPDDRGALYGLGFVCRVCGCTDDRACPGGCDWAAPNLCTACVRVEQARKAAGWRGFGLGLFVGVPAGFWLAIAAFRYFMERALHG